jgi:hypothetical protein
MEFFLLGAAAIRASMPETAALSLSSVFLANSSHPLNLNTSQFTYWFYIICLS